MHADGAMYVRARSTSSSHFNPALALPYVTDRTAITPRYGI